MKSKILIPLFYFAFWGCTSSTQTKREETTTTREVDTIVSVPPIRESGQSDNYYEWRKWILPVLQFEPDTVQPTIRFTSEDTSVSVSVNLRTGKTNVTAKPKPIEVKAKETTTHITTDIDKQTTSWLSEFGTILIWIAVILGLLLVGFLILRPKLSKLIP